MCPTNHGDCLKTQIFNIEDFKKKVEEKNNLTNFLNDNNFYSFEGHCQLEMQKVNHLIQLTNTPNISVMEIGFNAGHSAEVFLENNSSLTLTSFDLCEHKYVHTGKKYIDKTYPNRHVLITGDSTISIPSYINNNKNKKFDVIFIDGGHEYDIAKSDLENCFQLAHKDTIVAIDDTIYTPGWEQGYTIGPTKAWIENLNENKIIELYREDYCIGRGMSWGKYVM
jgi:predicted O-methyltransferase YrrM